MIGIIIGSLGRLCHKVTRWRDALMALGWTGAAMRAAPR
jgi:hypothetical protein